MAAVVAAVAAELLVLAVLEMQELRVLLVAQEVTAAVVEAVYRLLWLT